MKFSEKIKNLRQNTGLTQQELSVHIGITASAIGYLENGQRDPTGSTLIAYAKFFNVSIDSLVGLEPDIEDSIFSVVPASQLSDEEKELLKNFRKLPSGLKIRAQAYLSGMVEALTPEKKKTPGA